MKSTSISSNKESSPTQVQEVLDTEKQDSFLVVSFYSIGGGINGADVDHLKRWLENYTDVDFSITKWGPEGEHDFCITIDDKSIEQQIHIKAEIKSQLSDMKFVRMLDKEPCQQSRFGDKYFRNPKSQ